MMDFSGSAGAASSFDVIPAGVLVFANLTVRGVKASGSGGGYLDCELTIDAGQPYAGRKFWEMIGDPQNSGNSEKYRDMGTIAITRILEAGRGAGPHNMAGYQINSYDQLSGLRVGVKIGVEAGTGGHPDKNRVAEWLTPNPASQSGNKGWVRLMAGDHGQTQAAPAAAAQGGFGGFGVGNAVAGGQSGHAGFAAQNTNGQAAPSSGFGNAGGQAAAASGFQQPAGDAAQTAGATLAPANSGGFAAPATISPSDPGATPVWLAQAAGQ